MWLPHGSALDVLSALITDCSVFSVFLSENMAAKGFFPLTCCQKHWVSCATAPRAERVSRWNQRACLRECLLSKCLLRRSSHLCYLPSCLGFVYLTKQMCSLHGRETGTSCLGLFLWQRTEGETQCRVEKNAWKADLGVSRMLERTNLDVGVWSSEGRQLSERRCMWMCELQSCDTRGKGCSRCSYHRLLNPCCLPFADLCRFTCVSRGGHTPTCLVRDTCFAMSV